MICINFFSQTITIDDPRRVGGGVAVGELQLSLGLVYFVPLYFFQFSRFSAFLPLFLCLLTFLLFRCVWETLVHEFHIFL